MKKHMTGKVFLTGSRKTIERMIYTENGNYFIKWNKEYIEVENEFPNVTNGWKTVKAY